MTHNAYFYREVTYDPRRRGGTARNHETFWMVRKSDSKSVIEAHETNPVRTSYELLWDEVRNPRPGSATLQNTLRRILENYFKILGDVNSEDIVGKFKGADQAICRSLFAWVNAGSHYALDDIFVAPADTLDHYLRVFKEIFECSGHGAHYRMMMRESEVSAA